MTLRHGCSPVNLLHIFGIHFPKNISGWLPLPLVSSITAFRLQAYNNFHTLISLRRLLNYAFFCSVFLGWEKSIGTNWKVFFVRILISDYSVPKNNSDKGKFPKIKMVKFQYEKGWNLNPCFVTPKVTRTNKH